MVVVTVYWAVSMVLDWLSFVRPLQGLNITPWNPQPALAVALLLIHLRYWWAVLLTLVSAEVLVRGLPGDLFVVSLAAAALTCTYLAMATALKRYLGAGLRFGGVPGMARFLAVIASGALFGGVVYVGAYTVGGYPSSGPLWGAVARYWLGDVVGMLVALPLLVCALDAQRRSRLVSTVVHPSALLVGLAIPVLIWMLLWADGLNFNFSYLLLLPVIAAALRFGVAGAVLAASLTQAGLIVASQIGPHTDRLVFELQLLMATISITALLVGETVDERARADTELRQTLRLAAAGQMSAALAHELSQPLNAIGLYANACDVLSAKAGVPATPENERLLEVTRRMAADARRAGDVVKRLRDFFRSGDTRLEAVPLRTLLDDAVQAQSARLESCGAVVNLVVPDSLPPLWVDRVQMLVVLRNLLANGLDAAQAADAGVPPRLDVLAERRGAELTLTVTDNGPGLDAARANELFDAVAAGASTKPGGMGVGLSICRAIVDAHGGRLWAEPGPQGRFCLTLPLGVSQGDGHRHANPND